MTSPLHTVHRGDAVTACLARMTDDAVLLLLEDGVYAALAAHPQAAGLQGRRVYVLAEDLAARGLTDAPLLSSVRKIDMPGFVTLSIDHHPIVGWF